MTAPLDVEENYRMVERLTLIDDGRATEVQAHITAETIRLPPDALTDATGWHLQPQGLCKGAVCISSHSIAEQIGLDGIDLETFAEITGRPLALDVPERIAYLGVASAERAARLRSLDAPDFTLPDLDGRLRSLHDFRGLKVLLLAYASW